MKRKSLGINAFLNSLRSILNILFPIITFPYVSRILGAKEIGAYNFSNSIVTYFVLIAGLGIGTYAVREGAKYRGNYLKFNRFANEIFTINVYSSLLAYLLLFLCLIFFNKLHNYTALILIFSLQIIFSTLGVEWIYQIYEDYGYITLRSIIFQILSLILLFVFVRNSNDCLIYAAINVLASVGSNILNLIHVKKYCKMRLINKFNWRIHLTPILIIFAASIANMIYLNSDITLLGFMKNNYIVGIYSASAKIYQIVKTLIASLLIVTVPRLAMLFGQKRIKEYKAILTNLANMLLILVLPASVGLFMLAKEVILIISGVGYLRAVNSLRILCFAYIFSILSWILNDCVLIPARREKKVLISMTISAVLNIVINVLLIPVWDENAAAFSTVIAEFIMLVVNYYYSRDLVKNVYFSKEMLLNILTSGIGCVGIIIVCMLCDYAYQSLILKTFLSVVLSVNMYFAILILLKNKSALKIEKIIIKKLQLIFK